jgi:hypothetical protein
MAGGGRRSPVRSFRFAPRTGRYAAYSGTPAFFRNVIIGHQPVKAD